MTQVYGDYEVESFLGKGSIGKVYLARHRRIGRRVALKTVHLEQKFEDDDDQTEFYKRLQREAELCGSMQHPNVVTLYDVGYDGDVVSYLATEYVDGESLLQRLRRTRPLPLDEALSLAADVLRGLAYAHSKGIIHRDVKPANILLTTGGQAKIADFGVARPLHSSLTATRSLVGTPNYMSPEQVKTAPVSPRSDLFSAGVVMYEMLTGVKPFAAPELSGILYNVVNLVPPRVNVTNPSVPEAIARVVAKLLEKKPEDRYAAADEALAELELVRDARASMRKSGELETLAVLQGDTTTPLPTLIEPRPVHLLRRRVHPALFWLVTLLLTAALGGSVVALRRDIAAQKPAPPMTAEQLQETAAKRRSLEAARALTAAGNHAEAIRAYDTHLARYPESVVARTEREAAQQQLDAATKPKSEITRVARKPRAETVAEKPPEEPKKRSRWQRLKTWLAEDPSKPKKKE
ncbi:MAG TPA: serine/threonine-protein kinase [Thermoanaerobaculia bacterium]